MRTDVGNCRLLFLAQIDRMVANWLQRSVVGLTSLHR
jgi:hypothetical protein